MKAKYTALVSILTACLFTPVLSQAGNFDDAVKDANISLDKAKAVNYEWRDSRKMLKNADKLNKAGKSDEAMKLVTIARKQGESAIAQAELQSSVHGPH